MDAVQSRAYTDPMKLIDERLSVILKRDLSEHISLLKSWECKLKKLSSWYKSCGEEFEKFADNLSEQYELSRKCTTTVDVIFHDHAYCLKAYRNSRKIIVPHECDEKCVSMKTEREAAPLHTLNLSPLAVPLQFGWQRVVVQRCGEVYRTDTYYVAPCGRKLRSMDEVKQYLDTTGIAGLTGIHFTFDPLCSLSCPPYQPESQQPLVYIEDISKGKETVPVSCVNMFNTDQPDCMLEEFEYLTSRTFEPNVPHTDQPDFLVCCSCTDNCANRSKCECWQLTQEEAKVLGSVRYSVGYVHQRLKRPQHSAVYECSSHCQCGGGSSGSGGQRCCNSVVQAGICHRLQLFHTGNSQLNWGLRTLDDIPMGTFVCSYVGHVYTEMAAEKKALQHGDEYFAGLDYIEVMEYHKAGYEAEVAMSESSSLSSVAATQSASSNSPSSLSSVAPTASTRSSLSSVAVTGLSRQPSAMDNSSSDEESSDVELDASNTASMSYLTRDSTFPLADQAAGPHTQPDSNSPQDKDTPGDHLPNHGHTPPPHGQRTPPRSLKTRQYYKEDFNYIIDAKTKGNLARYINHSCDPNLFVQNVFVDTHDLRFPWVAFFAKRRIKAMEELTWDYNYEIGSVENKVIWCVCGTPNCRSRLL